VIGAAHYGQVVAIDVVYETHSTSEDNDRSVASGWAHSRLSAVGREQARALGERRRNDGLDAVFSSDLRRAVETTEIAFAGSDIPVLLDWRLRECDYGAETQAPVQRHHAERCAHLDVPYPGGESWNQAIQRVGRFVEDLHLRWDDARVLIIGHVATRWALEHLVNGISLDDLCDADFAWQEGWEFRLEAPR
jgi:2,3-bisphosphoglycerate-dependent phosphoglycerate mutase